MKLSRFREILARMCSSRALLATFSLALATAIPALAAPRIIVISLDGATPRIVEDLIERGVLARDEGLALLARRGVSARW